MNDDRLRAAQDAAIARVSRSPTRPHTRAGWLRHTDPLIANAIAGHEMCAKALSDTTHTAACYNHLLAVHQVRERIRALAAQYILDGR